MDTAARLAGLADKIGAMLANNPTDTATPGLLAGALFALHSAQRIGAVTQSKPLTDPRYSDELKAVLDVIDDPAALATTLGFRSNGSSKGSWLMGYYLTDASFRVRAAWERLRGSAGASCPLGSEVNHFKHGGGDKQKPVKRHALTVESVIDVVDKLLAGK